MIMKNTFFSPAKLNLFLEVKEKRKDGFHNIETVFCRISLYDIVEISIEPVKGVGSVCVEMVNGPDIAQEDNICYKAIELYMRKLRESQLDAAGVNVAVRIIKNIPWGAGLGGGSSNAAVVLKALNSYFKVLSCEELARVSSDVGSDVPFFMSDRKLAIGRGRGDALELVDCEFSMPFFVICPPIPMSTKEIYNSLKLTNEKRDVKIFLKHLCRGNKMEFYNRLYEPAIENYPKLREEMDIAEDVFKEKANLTGSGSAFFFPYNSYDEKMLRRLAKKAGKRGWKGFAVEPI